MRVLVGCEESGVVREALRKLGHDAWSCDLEPARVPGQHCQGDIFDILSDSWDMGIFFPPCTWIANCGNKHYAGTELRQKAADFIWKIWDGSRHIKRVGLENPVGQINTYLPQMPKPQYIQPWMFGHGETKKTGLWLRGLPDLKPTNIVDGREQRIWKMPPSTTRARDRSVTYSGIAQAMAAQWGGVCHPVYSADAEK